MREIREFEKDPDLIERWILSQKIAPQKMWRDFFVPPFSEASRPGNDEFWDSINHLWVAHERGGEESCASFRGLVPDPGQD
jgi:hypothetical protein